MVLLKGLADVDEGEEAEGDDSPEPGEDDRVSALDSMGIKLAGGETT